MTTRLRKSWRVVRLADVLAEPLINGRSVPTADDGFPVLRLTSVRNGRIDLSERKIGAWRREDAKRYLVSCGDFLVVRGNGSRSLVGRGGLVTTEHDPIAFPDTLIRIRTRPDLVDSAFLRWVWDSTRVRDQIERVARTTAGIYKINQQDLESLQIPLPSLPEQRRIVAALEEQLSDLDAAVAGLERARSRIAAYRQAVYDAACAGSLLSGKSHPSGSQGFPRGWCLATPADLASDAPYALAIGPFGSNLKVSDYKATGVPLVFVRNIRANSFGAEERRYVSETKAAQLLAHQVKGGDVLITKMGDPPGDACIYPVGAEPAIITADCIKWTVDASKADARYAICALRSTAVRRGILEATRGVAQLKVSLARFRTLELPLPPLSEQRAIAAEVDNRIERADRAAREIDVQVTRAARLRQSILGAAFEGRLVSQDVREEPMTEFLVGSGDEKGGAVPTKRYPRRTGIRKSIRPGRS